MRFLSALAARKSPAMRRASIPMSSRRAFPPNRWSSAQAISPIPNCRTCCARGSPIRHLWPLWRQTRWRRVGSPGQAAVPGDGHGRRRWTNPTRRHDSAEGRLRRRKGFHPASSSIWRLPEDLAPYSPADLAAWRPGGSISCASAVRVAPRSPSPIPAVHSRPSPLSTSPMTTCRSWSIRPWHSSMNAGLRSRSSCIRFSPCRRDAGGMLEEIVEGPAIGSGVIRESLMHVQSRAWPMTSMLGALEADIARVLADVRDRRPRLAGNAAAAQGCHRAVSVQSAAPPDR